VSILEFALKSRARAPGEPGRPQKVVGEPEASPPTPSGHLAAAMQFLAQRRSSAGRHERNEESRGPATPTSPAVQPPDYERDELDEESPSPCGPANPLISYSSSLSYPDCRSDGYTLITDADGVAHVAAAIEDWGGPVGLDTETTGLDPRTDRVRLIQLAFGADVFLIDLFAFPDPSAELTGLFEALAGVEVVGHNLRFDLQFLAPLGFVPGRAFCTMLASQVLHAGGRNADNGRLKHTLQAVAKRELDRELDKGSQSSDWSGDLTPDQLRYATADAAVLVPLADALRGKLKAESLTATFDLEVRALPGVAWAAPVTLDRDRWLSLAAAAEAERDRLAEEMDRLAPNPGTLTATRNWNAVGDVAGAFAAVGVKVAGTDDDALAAIDHPLAGLLRAYRSAAKRAGTYGKKWLRKHAPGGTVAPSWHQLGAESGRMSCSDPNLQQIPRTTDYRRCFVARSGHVLVKADYSQVELRIAARIAGEEVMILAYRSQQDLHTRTAAMILDKEMGEVTKADRQLAKAINFGLLFGMGWKSLRTYAAANYAVTLTDAQAREYREAFFRAYPGLAKWHREVEKEVKAVGRGRTNRFRNTFTRGGRRRTLSAVKTTAAGKEYPNVTEALNTPVQGTGADGLKAAIALLWERRVRCPGAVPVLFCHDEIVVEVPQDQAEQAADWLKRCMVDGMAPLIDPVPVEVDVTVGKTWGGD